MFSLVIIAQGRLKVTGFGEAHYSEAALTIIVSVIVEIPLEYIMINV